jgi:hypothetical protein
MSISAYHASRVGFRAGQGSVRGRRPLSPSEPHLVNSRSATARRVPFDGAGFWSGGVAAVIEAPRPVVCRPVEGTSSYLLVERDGEIDG